MSVGRTQRLLEKQRAQSKAARARQTAKPPAKPRSVQSAFDRIRVNGLRDERLYAEEDDGLVYLTSASGQLRVVVRASTYHALRAERQEAQP